ncbi:MBL fold metallo-hydrolase [Mycobacteroides franklinii]|uniref:MBL fold metallo-hydrolase n=1 Tax=Mycobacteroides franklinii TaxID=948102 RepID=UPI000993380C|nr:MBL fold metallo-hydrolase [Mycobacteroides franklinii]
MTTVTYAKGLHDLGNGCYAWLQPDGGWGLSNSGLVTGSGASLLIDTLYDLTSTREMLDGIAILTDRNPIATVVNTHSDGDHYFGNQLVAGGGVQIIASQAAAELMTQESVEEMAAITRLSGSLGDLARKFFGSFDFEGIVSTGPTRTFTDQEQVDVGGREVHLIQVGPAHTPGDTLVHVPDAKTLYAGDILFIGGTPIVWAGPPQRWVGACDLILDLDLRVIVPGHGPVTDKRGVHEVREYLSYIIDEATKRFDDGLSLDSAIESLGQGKYADMPEHSRIVQNVVSVYQTLDPATTLSRLEVFERIAALEGIGTHGKVNNPCAG